MSNSDRSHKELVNSIEIRPELAPTVMHPWNCQCDKHKDAPDWLREARRKAEFMRDVEAVVFHNWAGVQSSDLKMGPLDGPA